MGHDTSTLAGLIGSRICHDLVSPIGAVTNGLELLEMSGVPKTPELKLVAESVAHANARIRFFRVAFGLASSGQMIGGEEVSAILMGLFADGRVRIKGFPAGSFARQEVRIVLLAVLCGEQAIPKGGEIAVDIQDGQWCVTARGSQLIPDPDLWARLNGSPMIGTPVPATVQFSLLPAMAAEADIKISTDLGDNEATITLTGASCRPPRQDT
ncbi:histidine phosphotransferase family protein [Roseovarius aestuariivivens]|uniref:histidine phosphotransferase family protein n=1 Tax=Roseovarius aestuariivivens TaxID=1888910 RepID=UPI001081B5E8|nr:histidine phosphotransferase family protein [Roseovarius aestuariivivens]